MNEKHPLDTSYVPAKLTEMANSMNRGSQTAYAVYTAKEKAKSSVSDFKRGMVQEQQSRQTGRLTTSVLAKILRRCVFTVESDISSWRAIS